MPAFFSVGFFFFLSPMSMTPTCLHGTKTDRHLRQLSETSTEPLSETAHNNPRHVAPLHHAYVRSCSYTPTTHAGSFEMFTVWLTSPKNRPRRVRFGFGKKNDRNRPTFRQKRRQKKRKTDRATSHFGFMTLTWIFQAALMKPARYVREEKEKKA